MIVDASALMTVVLGEDDVQVFLDLLLDNPGSRISAVNWFEGAIRADRSTSEPLLFKGDDFRHTDIEPALTD